MIGPSDTLFVHIPKTAGTSVEASLGAAKLYPQLGIEKVESRPHIDILFGNRLHHLTIREIRENYPEIAARERLFSFSVIRDPVDRFASYVIWRDGRLRFGEDQISDDELHGILEEDYRRLVAYGQWSSLFEDPFGGMVEHEEDPGPSIPGILMRPLIPQCCFLFDRGKVGVDAVYPLEALPSLEKDLERRDALVSPFGRRMVGALTPRLRSMFTPAQVHVVRQIYRHDVKLLKAVRDTIAATGATHCPGAAINIDEIRLSAPPLRRTPPTIVGPILPRRLWLYWHQGWKNAPPLVKRCAESWVARNPTWEVNLLTEKDLKGLIRPPSFLDKQPELPLPALSDLVRLHLLADHGGVWADATTWCARPLDDWLDHVLAAGFFAYSKPAKRRVFSSWFLAARPHHQIPERLRQAAHALWRRRTRAAKATSAQQGQDGYFWLHTLMAQLLDRDAAVAAIWRQVPTILARGPHILQRQGLAEPITPEAAVHIKNRMSNVYKLSHKLDLPIDLAGTTLAFLYRTLDPN